MTIMSARSRLRVALVVKAVRDDGARALAGLHAHH